MKTQMCGLKPFDLKTFLAVAMFGMISLFATQAAAQSCPSHAPLYCSNCSGYCCPDSHPYCTDDCQCSSSSVSCPSDAPLHCSNCGGYCCPNSHPYCTDDCLCSDGSGGGGGGGGGSCDAGYEPCGNDYCMPIGEVCCDYVGRPDRYCLSGTQCSSDGTCYDDSGGETGYCDPGYEPCGSDYCMPVGAVCCASVGRQDLYCQSGTTCTADGRCAVDDLSGNDGGGTGGCEAGYERCGDNYCMPQGSVCCDSVGRPHKYCLAGTQCLSGGGCIADGADGDASTSNRTDNSACSSSSGPASAAAAIVLLLLLTAIRRRNRCGAPAEFDKSPKAV